MSSLTRGVGIKRETTTVYAPETLLEERREDPHGLGILSRMLRDIWPQGGTFNESKKSKRYQGYEYNRTI